RDYLHKGVEGPPLLRNLRGLRIFERVLVTVSWRWARSLERFLGTRRLQPQLLLLVCTALIAAAWPLYARGLELAGAAPASVDPAFAAIWVVGAVCAVAGAQMARF